MKDRFVVAAIVLWIVVLFGVAINSYFLGCVLLPLALSATYGSYCLIRQERDPNYE